MARLYADENFPAPVSLALRQLGHDVLTVQQAGQANLKIPDEDVLAYAVSQQRAVVTHNRRHFVRLHRLATRHLGIVICTRDDDHQALASRIDQALQSQADLTDQLLRINRPAKP